MIDLKSAVTQRLRRAAGVVARRVRPRRQSVEVQRWGLDHDPAGRVTCCGLALSELPHQFGSPLHVVHGPLLRQHIQSFVEPLGAPQVCATYGLVSVHAVLTQLHEAGVDGVVGSVDELERSQALAIEPRRIVYAEPAPCDAALATVARSGVRGVVLSSLGMTKRCADVVTSQGIGQPLAVGWQIDLDRAGNLSQPESDTSTVDDVAAWVSSVERSEVLDAHLLRVVSRQPLRTIAQAEATAEAVSALLGQITERTGWVPADLLVSVEIPAETTRDVPELERRLNQALGTDVLAPNVDDACPPSTVATTVTSRIRAAGHTGGLLLEPGTSLTARSGMLLSTVLDIKTDREPTHVILDAGINLATGTLSEFHQLVNTTAPEGTGDRSVRIAGPICTPADVLYANWRLPRVDVGDVVAIMDTGARFVAESTSFSFPQPAVVMCDDSGVALVRAAETFERLIALDSVNGRPLVPDMSAT